MQSDLINTFDALQQCCQKFAKADVLAIDTEFVRTRTLYPILGLLQVCDGESIVLIDPIAIKDLSPFWAILKDSNITKVLHACSEDLEVFLHSGNCQPKNLIDSQIMMAFLGHGISLGYAATVQHFLGLELDKSESRTDWTKRPLTEKQLSYAAADVEHLFALFPKLLAQVTDNGWLPAVREECEGLINRKFTPIDAHKLYRQVKLSSRLQPIQLNRLKLLAAWRYQQAQLRDLPLSFVAKDHTLIGLAQVNPANLTEMSAIEGVEINDIRHKGKAMVKVLQQANTIPEAQYPKQLQRLDLYPGYKQTFKRLKSFLTDVAQAVNIGVENFASKKQMNHFLTWYYQLNDEVIDVADIDLMSGWRQDILQDKLLAFAKNGFK